MKRGEDMAQSSFVDSLFDLNFIDFAVFSVIFMLLSFLFTGVIRRFSHRSRRGSAVYSAMTAFVLAFLPFRLNLLPNAVEIPVFDFMLWMKNGNTCFSDIGLRQSFSITGDETSFYITLSQALFIIWLTGAVISLIRETVGYIRLKISVKRYARKCDNGELLLLLEEECKLKKVPAVMIYKLSSTPFAMGIFHPVILLPKETCTAEESRLILRHELEHIRRRDIAVKLIMVFFRCLNWFDPIAYMLCRRSFEDMEIAVDESITKDLDNKDKRIYSELIVKTATNARLSDISTYLSINGERLKDRISAILTEKKSAFLPTFLTFCVLFLLVIIVKPSNFRAFSATGNFGKYLMSVPIEEDPVLSDEELRSVIATNYDDAALQYVKTCLEKYSLTTMPDYYRIEKYGIEGCNTECVFDTGLINGINSRIVNVGYYIETAKKCGNTVHDEMIGISSYNGLYYNKRSYLVRRVGKDKNTGRNIYHIDKIGLAAPSDVLFNVNGGWHFTDNIPEIERYCGKLAEEGLLDHSEADCDVVAEMFSEKNRKSTIWKETEPNGLFEYCGYDFDFESQKKVSLYGNVCTDKPHGVKITYICNGNNSHDWMFVPTHIFKEMNKQFIKCTELYPSIEYTDTFDKIDFADIPAEATSENARARLEYMMTPRDGTDFTVLAYTNITESDGAVYADVRFKGRLEGVYSESRYIDEHGGENEWYMPDVRII